MSEQSGKFGDALTALGRAAVQKVAGALGAARDARVEYRGAESAELVYARGFILCQKGGAPQTVSGWSRWDLGEWLLHVDPRVPVEHAAAGAREAWIVGDAFHPADGVFKDVAQWVLEGDLLENLDGIAGRFLLVYRNGTRIEVYHDAMGSRSVFYGEGVVASHAGLAAEVTGNGLRTWVIPFITSRSYLQRDVKYLPGLDSPFEGVTQLTPNCRLVLGKNVVERYWPRGPQGATDPKTALTLLVGHLQGLKNYFRENGISPLIGLSAGRDSRGVFAALAALQPRIFTFVRSRKGDSSNSEDSRAARSLAAETRLNLEIIKLVAPAPLDDASSSFAVTFRQNTGYVRGNGNSAGWVEHFADSSLGNHIFVRGFGGEVMRGFYPEIQEPTPEALSNLYDLNAGSRMSRDAFARFIEIAGWHPNNLFDYKLCDLFYWEHRMGIWGASALSEFDMAARSMPGYNSRELFMAFMGLPVEVDRKELFERAVKELSPALGEVPYSN